MFPQSDINKMPWEFTGGRDAPTWRKKSREKWYLTINLNKRWSYGLKELGVKWQKKTCVQEEKSMWKKSYGDEGGTSQGEQQEVPVGWSVGHKSNGQDWKGIRSWSPLIAGKNVWNWLGIREALKVFKHRSGNLELYFTIIYWRL